MPKGFAPLAIGMALTPIHLVSITVPNTSEVRPRPVVGAVAAGLLHVALLGHDDAATLEDASQA